MSKQVYIDENGNEIQVSGTVNTADMMPMSGNDSTKVSEAIGSLSTLTTTDKSSLVGAVNSIIAGLQGSEQNIITPTATGVTNYSAFGNSWYVQRGKLVWVHIGVQGLTPNASHTITTLPAVLKPMTNVCSGGQGGETYTAYATASVATDGSVKVASVDHYAIVDILYFAKA